MNTLIVFGKNLEKVFANITEYTIENRKSWELDIQIPEEISITGMTINILSFTFTELDFDIIEEQANAIIKKLII